MNDIVAFHNSPVSMTSRDIAELVEKRHDNVKRTVEALVEQGVIESPQIEEIPTATKPVRVYVFDAAHKRDTFIVVAQLSPAFTAALVDRWQELEQREQGRHAIPQTYAEALQLAADQARQLEHQAKQIEAAKPAIAFHERVATAEDAHTLDEAAKILRAGPRKLRQWMKDNKILRADGLPYQNLMDRGYFRVIEKTIDIGYGHKLYAQPFITGKGLQWLQRRLDGELMGMDV